MRRHARRTRGRMRQGSEDQRKERLRTPAAACGRPSDRTTANVCRVGAYAASPGSMPCSRKVARSLSSSVFSRSRSLATVLRPAADPAHSFSRSARSASNCFSLSRSAVAAWESCRAAAASFARRTYAISWSRSSRSGCMLTQRSSAVRRRSSASNHGKASPGSPARTRSPRRDLLEVRVCNVPVLFSGPLATQLDDRR